MRRSKHCLLESGNTVLCVVLSLHVSILTEPSCCKPGHNCQEALDAIADNALTLAVQTANQLQIMQQGPHPTLACLLMYLQ